MKVYYLISQDSDCIFFSSCVHSSNGLVRVTKLLCRDDHSRNRNRTLNIHGHNFVVVVVVAYDSTKINFFLLWFVKYFANLIVIKKKPQLKTQIIDWKKSDIYFYEILLPKAQSIFKITHVTHYVTNLKRLIIINIL